MSNTTKNDKYEKKFRIQPNIPNLTKNVESDQKCQILPKVSSPKDKESCTEMFIIRYVRSFVVCSCSLFSYSTQYQAKCYVGQHELWPKEE